MEPMALLEMMKLAPKAIDDIENLLRDEHAGHRRILEKILARLYSLSVAWNRYQNTSGRDLTDPGL